MKISMINVLVVVASVSSYCHSSVGQYEACRDGRVRLISTDGDTAMEGRVEVCITGKWKEVGYCGRIEAGASVICNQLGYSQIGAEAFVTLPNRDLTYLSCSGDETRVSECRCEPDCCQANATLMVRCKPVECSESIVVISVLGVVSGLLLALLLGSCVTIVILGVKLKRTQRRGRYKSEPHHYEEQHIGRIQASDPAYDDPITWKQKDSEPVDQKKDREYINTDKCVAYRQNPTTTTTFCTLSLPSSQCRPTSQADEYEVMQQLNYKGDIYRH